MPKLGEGRGPKEGGPGREREETWGQRSGPGGGHSLPSDGHGPSEPPPRWLSASVSSITVAFLLPPHPALLTLHHPPGPKGGGWKGPSMAPLLSSLMGSLEFGVGGPGAGVLAAPCGPQSSARQAGTRGPGASDCSFCTGRVLVELVPMAPRPDLSVITAHRQADSSGNYQHFESCHSPRSAR